MDNSSYASLLMKTVDEYYPVDYLSGEILALQSARRWAIFELISALLDNPFDDPMDIAERIVGRIGCMIYILQNKGESKRVNVLGEAMGAILHAEENLFNH